MERIKFPKGPKVPYESTMQGPGGVFFPFSCELFNDATSKYRTYKWQTNL
jgi:hypothetical protein